CATWDDSLSGGLV
nr:immunoglobulin light chain junction region [Macaca mulatta]